LKAEATEISSLHQLLNDAFPRHRIVERNRFVIEPRFVEQISCGEKTTTIRYQANSVEYPSAEILPLVSNNSDRTQSASGAVHVRVVGVCYKAFSQLDTADAQRDGFISLAELREALHRYYGALRATDIVSIFSIAPDHEGKIRSEPEFDCVSGYRSN
jgi:hypothetical protein